MSIVTGKIVTLDQSIIESNAKKYVGYITRCDNSYSYNGTWSPNTSVTGIGVSVLDNILSVWNTNSDTSDVSRDFTWTSSKLSDCTKTFTVVAKGKNCPTYNVILVSEFNDDSDGLLESVSGNIQLYLYSIVGSGGTSSDSVCSNAINKVGEVTSQPSTIPNNCSGVDNVKFIFDNVNLTCSFSGNIGNFTVSGGIEYRLGDSGLYTILKSVDNYTISTTSNSATIGKCSIEDTTLWSMMDGSKTLYLKHVINMNYVTVTCPEASFNVNETKCDIYSTTTVFVNVTNWGSVTSGKYNSWGSISGNNLKLIADKDKNKNYSIVEISDYDSRFKEFSVIIRHEKASTCSDNSLDDVLRLHLTCLSSNTILSSITISPNYGNFVTTFNKGLSSGNAIEIYIKNGNCTQNIAIIDSPYAPTTQDAPIWRSALDMPCNNNCDNSCNSVNFTIGWRIIGTVNIRHITANGTNLVGSESNTFTLNPCTSSNFNISVDLY